MYRSRASNVAVSVWPRHVLHGPQRCINNPLHQHLGQHISSTITPPFLDHTFLRSSSPEHHLSRSSIQLPKSYFDKLKKFAGEGIDNEFPHSMLLARMSGNALGALVSCPASTFRHHLSIQLTLEHFVNTLLRFNYVTANELYSALKFGAERIRTTLTDLWLEKGVNGKRRLEDERRKIGGWIRTRYETMFIVKRVYDFLRHHVLDS